MNKNNVFKMKSGIYRCTDHIENFKLRITLKKLCNSTIHSDIDSLEKEVKTFSWQEKSFSISEIKFYAKKSNCLSDLEKNYHDNIVLNYNKPPGILFTYIEGDTAFPLQNEESVTTEINSNKTELHKEIIRNLKISKKIKDTSKSINVAYEINKFLNNSITNSFTSNCYETMYVMGDLGDSEKNSNFSINSEHILCIIKYDKFNKILWIYPDFSRNLNDTYSIEIDVGGKVVYEYTIENVSYNKNINILIQEKNILKKINERNRDKRSEILMKDFELISKDLIRFYLFFEIQNVKHFNCSNVYVLYHIDLPEEWSCNDEKTLCGSTQTCKIYDLENIANFGYNFEVCLDYKISKTNDVNISSYPQIFFQIISNDNWNRNRCEGLSYKFIPIFESGMHTFTLQCIRIQSSNNFIGELRRFFIGDYFNIEDISWIGLPKNNEENTINKYGVPVIGTGTIDLKLNIIRNQSNILKEKTTEIYQNMISHRLYASALVKSVTEVILAYRRARKNMLLARRNVFDK